MRKLINIMMAAAVLALPLAAIAQTKWPAGVTFVASKGNETVSGQGDLSQGRAMDDLSWASSSSNACFPATQNSKFRGNHVFFATNMPGRSIMTISVTPEDSSTDLSLYAYMMGGNSYDLVPDLARCITCEADHKWDRPWKGKVQTSERHVEFQNPGQNPYNIVIGVSGPKGTSGKFKVEIKTKS